MFHMFHGDFNQFANVGVVEGIVGNLAFPAQFHQPRGLQQAQLMRNCRAADTQ